MAESKDEGATPKADNVTETKSSKAKFAYFRSPVHAGLTIQVQKMVKQPDNTEKQEVDEQATFTQYYDTWKGDVVRVGYLKTDSPKIVKACQNDANVEEIDEKEYNQAVEGDAKNKPLQKAPVAAA